MSNIDKRALREAAEKAISEEGETWWNEDQLASDYGLALHRTDAKFIAAAKPATALALLDELEAKDLLNTELMEKQRLIDICQGQGLEHRIAAEKRAEAAEKRNERALSLLSDANTENVWDVIGRLKVVIGGDYRSEDEIAAAGKGEAS
jgi:hypothetical protein